jgi:hypothetical protein
MKIILVNFKQFMKFRALKSLGLRFDPYRAHQIQTLSIDQTIDQATGVLAPIGEATIPGKVGVFFIALAH